MNQEKIGALIAKLRKEKGLTQSDLGAKVGVGFKAVSKWERGITCPDISIINELSKILGITSDELLSGKLNEEHKSLSSKGYKFNKKLLFFIIPIAFLIIGLFIIINQNKHKTYIYDLTSINNDEYSVEGKMTFENDDISIYISKLSFIDTVFNETIIKNYQYELIFNDVIVNKFGFVPVIEMLDSEISVLEFTNTFNINYNNKSQISNKEVINNSLILRLIFVDMNDDLIEKEIAISINKVLK